MLVLILLAVAKLTFHLATNGQYGFHRDELQTFADARHLAWGYVAYPPLTPFLARVEIALFGTSLRGFRLLSALAESVTMVVSGLMARHFGGGRAAQIVAGVAAAIAPVTLGSAALFQYVAFDYLWFVLMAYFVLRLIDANDPRWWLAIGAVIGLGVETKYTMAFFTAGLVVGVFLTPLRAHLRSKWLWFGVALSIVIAAPNLIWQAQHDFISFEFLRSIHARDMQAGRTQSFLIDQLYISSNAVAVPLWVLGLVAVFRDRRHRIIGWMAVVPFALFWLAHGRGYYTAALYPMLLAAGAAALERRVRGWRPAWIAVGVLLAIGAASSALVVLPITPIHSRIWNFASVVNGDFAEELGWPELTREVARIYATIPPQERARTGIYGSNYGEAGAIDLYGPAYGLPHAISGVNSYWLRGPGNPPPRTLIVLGSSRQSLQRRFDSVILAGHTPDPFHVRNEETTSHPDIFLCRGLRVPIEQLWPRVRSFG